MVKKNYRIINSPYIEISLGVNDLFSIMTINNTIYFKFLL